MATYLVHFAKSCVSPLTNVASWYNRVAVQSPFTTAVITTGLKTTVADLVAQKVFERRENIDWQRNAIFTSFGFAYLGCFQYYLYNIKFAKWCKGLLESFGKIGMPAIKVSLDQFVHHPFIYFPTFYMIKGVVKAQPIQETYQKYKAELWDNCKASWSIWLPAQFINFSLVPRHLRIPYVAMVSFGWMIVLSMMQSNFEKESKVFQETTESKVVEATAN